MAKPIKKVLQSLRNGKPLAIAIAESDLDPEERDILVMSVLDIVRETRRLETTEDWAARITQRIDSCERAITALIEHERKTREAFVAMSAVLEDLVKVHGADLEQDRPGRSEPYMSANGSPTQSTLTHTQKPGPFKPRLVCKSPIFHVPTDDPFLTGSVD